MTSLFPPATFLPPPSCAALSEQQIQRVGTEWKYISSLPLPPFPLSIPLPPPPPRKSFAITNALKKETEAPAQILPPPSSPPFLPFFPLSLLSTPARYRNRRLKRKPRCRPPYSSFSSARYHKRRGKAMPLLFHSVLSPLSPPPLF